MDQTPTPSDLMWEKAAAEVTPEKTLARVTENARFVVSTVGVVGVLLGGLGFLAASAVQQNWLLLAGAFATSVLAAIAVTIALFTLIARNKQVAVGNLDEVEAWYLGEIDRRRGSAAASMFLFLAAVVAAGVALVGGVAAVEDARDPDIALHATLQSEASSDGGFDVSLSGEVDGLKDDQEVRVEITANGSTFVRLIAQPDEDGNVNLDAAGNTVSDADVKAVIQVLDGAKVVHTRELRD